MTPFGFVPIGTTDGADYHGKMRSVIIDDGAAAFVGDMMVAGGTPLAADETLRVTPAASAAAGNTLVGALSEIFPDFTDEGSLIRNYAPAGTDRSGRIIDGSDVIFAAREDALVTPIDGTLIGGSVDLITGTGDTVSGASAMALDSNTAAADKAQALNILRLGRQVGNGYVSAAPGAVFEVSINPVA